MSQSRPSDQELIQAFQSLKSELQGIAAKIGDLEAERDEHSLVIDTLKVLTGGRKCYRSVGGVLVQQTVGTVLPTLVNNVEGLKGIIQQLATTYKKKEDDSNEFQKKWNIKIATAGADGRPVPIDQ